MGVGVRVGVGVVGGWVPECLVKSSSDCVTYFRLSTFLAWRSGTCD